MGALASRGGEPARRPIHELPQVLEAAEPGARQPERRVPVHARVGARDDPGRPRDAGHDRGRVPVDPPDAGAAEARASCRASWTTSSPRWPTSPSSRTARSTSCPCSTTSTAASYDVVLPTQEQRIDDGALSTGLRNYEEFFQAHGLAGRRVPELRRQRALRAHPGGRRPFAVQTPVASGAHGTASRERESASRSAPARRKSPKPPYKPEREVLHAAGVRPERRADRGRPVMRQIKKQARGVRGDPVPVRRSRSGSAGYILSNQRFYLPAWVPVLGTDFYRSRPSCRPPRPSCPGQGQTVNIAGVKIGEVGTVQLEDGKRRRRA